MSETSLANHPMSAEPDYDAIAAQILADITELEKKMDAHSAASDRHLASISAGLSRIEQRRADIDAVLRRLSEARS